MSKLFKNTLVAAAIAGVSSVAVAGTLGGTTTDYSAQGAALATSTATTAASFTHTVNAGFAINDLITYTVTAGSVNKTAGWPATINFNTAGSGGATMVATLLDASAVDTATYRVTTVTATTGQTTIGASATVALTHNTSSFTADVTVDVEAKLSNGVTEIDAGTKTHKIVDSKDQLGDIKVATSADLDGVISVAAQRKALVGATTDAFTFTTSNDTSLNGAVTVTGTTVTLKGDFAGFKDANFASAGTGVAKYDDAKKELVVTYTGPVTTDTITITPPVTDAAAETEAVVLNAQDFTVSGVATFGTASSEDLGSTSAGAWTLDGAVVSVPYMPYGANISQILYVTNEGSLDADVSVTAIDEAGTMYDLGVIAESKKGTVTGIAGQVRDGLAAEGFTGGKVALTVTVNAQDKDVTVYASYNVGGADRGFVNTSQYKGK
ncbi:hypothetical protein [Thalassotalea montiporae]